MDATTSNLESLATRIEKVERENRLFRRGGMVLFLLCSTLIVMGQAQSSRIVEAQGFALKDAHGIDRATLSLTNDIPMLTFLDSSGQASVRLSPGGFAIYGVAGTMALNEGTLSFQDKNGHFVLLANGSNASLSLSSVEKGAEGTISMIRNPDGLRLNVIDAHKFRTIIGNTGVEIPSTGESRTTSAASIIMFNDKDDLIWRAPSR